MERPERLSLQSADGAQLNLDALYQIAPSCFTEATDPKTGKIKRVVNFDVLRQLLGDDTVEDATEAYEFNWVGKQEARAEVLRPINKTLRPVKEDSVDWDYTQNLYIEGDNLEVLKLLQKSYLGKVKMIYIDPPYNTGNDFVYHDDFAQSAVEYDESNRDEEGNRFRKNTDSNGRFHSDWCSMIYTRLMNSRSLLSNDGLICISIDHHEVVNLANICDIVFGSDNRVGIISVINNLKGRSDDAFFATCNEFLLVYAKNKFSLSLNGFKLEDEELDNDYEKQDEIGYYKLIGFRKTGNAWKRDERPFMFYPILFKDGIFSSVEKSELELIYNPVASVFNDDFIENLTEKYTQLGYKVTWPKTEAGEYGRWRWGVDTFYQQKDTNLEYNRAGTLCTKMRATFEDGSVRVKSAKTLWYKPEYDTGSSAKVLKSLFGKADIFDNPKSLVYLTDLLTVGSQKDSIVLDFFSGSATFAHAVMKLNAEDGGKRRFIMVQWPEETPKDSEALKAGYKNICEIGKERIRRAGKKIKEEHPEAKDLDTGFRVFRIDESNFEDVERTPKEYNQDQLELFLNNVKSDRDDLDLLFGCMLDWGVKLSLPMSSEEVDGKMIYTVNEGDLVACFAEKVTDSVVKAMADKQPLRVIFRDSCFEQDADKINIYETFKQLLDWSDKDVEKNIRVI